MSISYGTRLRQYINALYEEKTIDAQRAMLRAFDFFAQVKVLDVLASYSDLPESPANGDAYLVDGEGFYVWRVGVKSGITNTAVSPYWESYPLTFTVDSVEHHLDGVVFFDVDDQILKYINTDLETIPYNTLNYINIPFNSAHIVAGEPNGIYMRGSVPDGGTIPQFIGIDTILGTGHSGLNVRWMSEDGDDDHGAPLCLQGNFVKILIDGHAGGCEHQAMTVEGLNTINFCTNNTSAGYIPGIETDPASAGDPAKISYWNLRDSDAAIASNFDSQKTLKLKLGKCDSILDETKGLSIDLDDNVSCTGGVYFTGIVSNGNMTFEDETFSISSIAADPIIRFPNAVPKYGFQTKLSYNGTPYTVEANSKIQLAGGLDVLIDSPEKNLTLEYYYLDAPATGAQYWREVARGNSYTFAQQPAIADSEGGDEVGKINTILGVLRAIKAIGT